MSRKRKSEKILTVSPIGGIVSFKLGSLPTENFKVKHPKVKSSVAKEYRQLSKDIANKVKAIRQDREDSRKRLIARQRWSGEGVNKMFNNLLSKTTIE